MSFEVEKLREGDVEETPVPDGLEVVTLTENE